VSQVCERKEVLVKLDNISLSFDGRPVLSDINAEVRDIVRPGCVTGQVVGILGPSGVGKTQLSRIMTGLMEPTTGAVRVGVRLEPIHAGLVGYVAQNYPLLRHRTVLGNLMVAARRSGLSSDGAKDKAMGYLGMFGLQDKWDAYPAQLSGGQRQRIAIAQQLLCSEHFLILDEPTTGLDPIMKDKVCGFIRQVASLYEENTIFVITHDISAILTIADTLWVLGRRKDAAGNAIGATIVKTYDLIERGIAWETDVATTPQYRDAQREIRSLFETL
jgi:polar amino acid transport system ATP-binding protein/sulfate transport system ATP-binding protein